MAGFTIKTTGLVSTRFYEELELTLNHPETFLTDSQKFLASDILDATSLQTSLDAGEITIEDSLANPISQIGLAALISQVNVLETTSNPVSITAGNLLQVDGTDSKAFLSAATIVANQALASLGYDALTTTLTFTNALGVPQNLDLSGLTTDVYINGHLFDPATMMLTLQDNDGATPDVIINLGALRGAFSNIGSGSWQYDPGNGSTFDITTLAAEPTQILTVGANNGLLLTPGIIQANETTTSISYIPATHIINYVDEAGLTTPLNITMSTNDLSDVDTATATPQDGDLLEYQSGTWVPTQRVYGTSRNFFEYKDSTILTNDTTTAAPAISENTGVLPVGEYKITISYNWNYNSQANDFEANFFFGGLSISHDASGNIHKQEPKDSAGNYSGTGSNQKFQFHKILHTSVSVAESKAVLLEYRSALAATTAAIWDIEIEIIRVA